MVKAVHWRSVNVEDIIHLLTEYKRMPSFGLTLYLYENLHSTYTVSGIICRANGRSKQ